MLGFMDLQSLLDDLAREVAPFAAQGKVADYIPALAAVDPTRFGIALAMTDGQLYGSGDWRVPFSIQSVSKAFSLALVLARDGEALWKRVGREPSGNPFNSLVQLEYEKGIPRNPFLNAGALILIDRRGIPWAPCGISCAPKVAIPRWTSIPKWPPPRPPMAIATRPWPTSWPAAATWRIRWSGCSTTTSASAPSP